MYNMQVKTSTQKILLVGFGENAFAFKEDLNQHFSETNFQTIDRLVDQSEWLGKEENGTDIQVVICDYDYMMKHNFMFLKQLQNNVSLKKLPFILINRNNMPVDVKELLSVGVDDCYSTPIDWKGMSTRIQFLEKYKPFIISKENEWNENPLQ